MAAFSTAFSLLVVFLASLYSASCQRACRNTSLAINSVTATISLAYDASSTATTGKLGINVSWTIAGSPDAIDGFLLKVRSTSRTDNPPLRPLQPCIPAGAHIWIGGSECAGIGPPPTCTGAATSSCICNATCSTYQQVDATTCKGTVNQITDGFTPYSKNTRSAIFEGNFHEPYQADLFVYFREVVLPPSPVIVINRGNADCPALISSDTNLTPLQAVATCCDLNVTQVKPIYIRQMTSVNLTAATVTLTITWLPPVLQRNLVGFSSSATSGPTVSVERGPTEIVSNPVIPPALRIPCYNGSRGFRMVLTSLLPGENYTYTIRSNYDVVTTNRYCSGGLCGVITFVHLPNTTLCDPYYNACGHDPMTVCGRNGTSYVCSCKEGYTRDLGGMCHSGGTNIKTSLYLTTIGVVLFLHTLLSQN